MLIDIDVNNDKRKIKLENTLYVPDLRTNLLSVAKLVDKGNKVIFDKNIAVVKNKEDGKIKMIANRIGNLYYLQKAKSETAQYSKINENNSKLLLWRNRMAHLNENSLRQVMQETHNVNFKEKQGEFKCSTCAISKQTVKPFKHVSERCNDYLEIIHSDACGPFNTTTIS